MENEKNTLPEDSWFDNLLNPNGAEKEIEADEHAVSGSGLSSIADMELEKILTESAAENYDSVAEDDLLASEPLETELPEEPMEEPSPEAAEEMSAEDAAAPCNEEEAPTPDEAEASEEAAEEVTEETDENAPGKPPRKVRPRRKKGYGLFGLPHLAATFIWLAIAVTIGISFGRLLWVCASDVLAFGREDQKISITITENDDLDSIIDKLYNAGLIKYRQLFRLYADLAKLEEKNKIKPGTYELNTLYDYHALVDAMSSTGVRKEIEVTIPEGYTCAQIFALLEERGICTVEKLEKYAETSKFSSYWFLEGMERGSKYCLEGFLFPDTYKFYENDDPRNIYHKMLSRFDEKFTDEMTQQLETLNQQLAQMYRRNGMSQAYIDEHKISVYELITVASMIEKETAHSGESPRIASVIYNRLTNPSKYPMLNIDATIIYALGGKTAITPENKYVDHPYNTYVYEGLPPGPISNPGLFSITAALNPTESTYYFYALDVSIGEHRFFNTYEEHKAFIESLG